VLVVEDELLVALDIADALKGAGAEVIVSRTIGDALSQAETQSLTAAVIDHVLYDGITTSDVCAKLKERKIPFIV
jgi:DNA-binding response OmpR family regulator